MIFAVEMHATNHGFPGNIIVNSYVVLCTVIMVEFLSVGARSIYLTLYNGSQDEPVRRVPAVQGAAASQRCSS